MTCLHRFCINFIHTTTADGTPLVKRVCASALMSGYKVAWTFNINFSCERSSQVLFLIVCEQTFSNIAVYNERVRFQEP